MTRRSSGTIFPTGALQHVIQRFSVAHTKRHLFLTDDSRKTPAANAAVTNESGPRTGMDGSGLVHRRTETFGSQKQPRGENSLMSSGSV